MKVIGITGSFGTGKSFVAAEFRALGASVIDADRIAHRLLRKGSPVYRRVVSRFGGGVVSRSGAIDRAKLGGVVFADRAERLALERIIHPAVIRELRFRMKRLRLSKPVVIDAPLLIEAGLGRIVDEVVVVKASRARQIARCVKKFGLTEDEVLRRIDSQMPLAEKIRMADHIIDNNGTKQKTRTQVRKAWCRVWK